MLESQVAVSKQSTCLHAEKALELSKIVDLAAGTGDRAVKSFYAYTGSLTAPPCTENIQWFVQSKVVAVGSETIKEHWQHIHGHPGNSRPIQPRNGALSSAP